MLTTLDHIASACLVLIHGTFALGLWKRKLNAGALTKRIVQGCSLYGLGLGVVLAAWFSQQRTVVEFGLGWPTTTPSLIGLGVGFVCACLSWLAACSAKSDGFDCEACRYEYLSRLVWGIWGHNTPVPSVAPLLGAFTGAAEEIVFRGWFLWYFAQLANELFFSVNTTGLSSLADLPSSALWSGVIISSALFALVHAPARRMKLVCFSLVVGLGAGACFVLTESLWPPLIVHALHNAAMANLGLQLSRLPLPSPDAVHLADE